MKGSKNRKTSPELQKQMNPGAQKNARVRDIGNPSGRENQSIPRGRGSTSTDHSDIEDRLK